MARERRGIDAKNLHVKGNLAQALRRVGVKQGAALVCDLCEFLNRVDRPYLVVGVHDRHELGVGSHGRTQVVGVDMAGLTRIEDRDVVALLLEVVRGLEDRMVLERRHDEVRTAIRSDLGQDADQRCVV